MSCTIIIGFKAAKAEIQEGNSHAVLNYTFNIAYLIKPFCWLHGSYPYFLSATLKGKDKKVSASAVAFLSGERESSFALLQVPVFTDQLLGN